MDKKYRLTKIKLDEVSLVGSGDDARANVVLSKSDSVPDESDSIPANQLGGNGMGRKQGTPAIIDKSALPDDVQEYINALEDVVLAKDDDDTTDDFEDEAEDEFEDEDDDGDAEDEDDSEDESPAPRRGVKVGKGSRKGGQAPMSKSMRQVLAKADPEVRDLIAKMQTDVDEANRIAKHERDERERKEWITKAQTLTHINDNPDNLGGLLKALHDKAPQEAVAVEKLLKAANAQVAKSGLFDEIGRSAGDYTGSGLDMRVAELRKADPKMTREQAETKALEMDPSLYDDYLAGR
jgi:hypothetical protein